MLTENIIQQLKKTNISADPEKTKERTKEVWKGASKEDQEAILSLSGVARTTVQRVYTTGNISAKLVFSIAQALNLNPLYLIGEADESGEYSIEIIKELLQRYKYTNLLPELEKKERRPRKASKKAADAEPAAPTSEEGKDTPTQVEVEKVTSVEEIKETPSEENKGTPPSEEVEMNTASDPVQDVSGSLSSNEPSDEAQKFIDEMSEEDMIFLMKSIMLRAKAGGQNAELAKRLKLLLLS